MDLRLLAIINLSRNIGGSIGISVVTTGIARGEQAHQVTLVEHVTPQSPFYRALVDQLASTFIQEGLSASDATCRAQVHQQAQLLAFLDDFRWLALAFLVLLPLVLLLKPLRQGNVEPVHHSSRQRPPQNRSPRPASAPPSSPGTCATPLRT